MIDVHAHILPNIDDGSGSIDETFKMIGEACDAGFSDIITTSHYIEETYNVNRLQRKQLISAINAKLKEKNVNINIHNGAEIYASQNMADEIYDGTIPTLANSRYVLFEIPMNSKILYLDRIIENLIGRLYVPIIAHPERYAIVQDNPNIVLNWINKGVLLQCNYGSLVGGYGNRAKKTIIKLLNANAVHFLGTDCHNQNSIYTAMDEIKEAYYKIIGKEEFEKLSTKNPACILNNVKIEIDEPKKIKRFF